MKSTENPNRINNNEDHRKLAYEEWKVLQEIISRRENFIYQMRNWLYTLSTAFIIAIITKEIQIDKKILVFSELVFIISFYIIEITQRIPIVSSSYRVNKIVQILYDNSEYDQPIFNTSKKNNIKKNPVLKKLIWKEAISHRIWSPYLMLLILISAICYFL
ncbi:hypothetical protein ES708_33339 [subsurface metagenome]